MEQQVFSPRKACLIYCEIDQKQHKEESKMTRSLRADCHLFCIYAGNSQSTFLTVRHTRVGCLQYRVKVEKKNEISEERHFQKDERCYYLISIESGFSVGSYDVSQISEELVFRIGQKGETYKGMGKDEIKIEALPVLADKDGAIGSSTSDSERAMITEDVTEVLTLIYSFSGNDGLEKALEYGRKYLEKYGGAQNLESWIVE